MKKLFEIFAEKASRKNRKIIQKKSTFSCFSEFRQLCQIRIKSIDSQKNLKDSIMFAKKQFRKRWNIIHKWMRFSMFNQIQIINYFKSVSQSNFTSIKSIKFSTFINCFNSTFRFCFSVNQITKTSQYQRIAIDETSDLKIRQKIKNCFSFRFFEQEYIVVADVDHTKKNIRVETSLTNARKYNSIKSSIKLFKSFKLFRKFKFNVFSSKFNSTSRVCSSVNQDARTSHIAFDEILNSTSYRSFKFFKFAVFINSFNSTFRFCSSVNQTIKTSQYRRIAIESSIKLFKSLKSSRNFKFSIFISKLSSTLRFYLLINNKSIMSQILISIYKLQIFQSAGDLRLN